METVTVMVEMGHLAGISSESLVQVIISVKTAGGDEAVLVAVGEWQRASWFAGSPKQAVPTRLVLEGEVERPVEARDASAAVARVVGQVLVGVGKADVARAMRRGGG